MNQRGIRPVNRRITQIGFVLALLAALLLTSPGRALADHGSGYYVTFVARSCSSYTDVFANKARNDIQESLKDLGPDSPYNNQASLVDPTIEDGPPQAACKPLPGWKFTLGHNYVTRAVSGAWGSLSKVTDPFPGQVTTENSTPLYDQYHNRVPGQTLEGATTVELSEAEYEQASQGSQLWVQGGTADDPVLAEEYPGPQYGFAALRCATDDVNGDNVEYLFFPSGVTHVFCYAFYILPPPTSGTITIVKRVVGAPAGQDPSFPFSGSLSFDPNGFVLANGGSMRFFRAGGQTWTVTEGHVDDYKLDSAQCRAQADSGGSGDSQSTVHGPTIDIHLIAGERVRCTYTNTYRPPAGGLTIAKITHGGVGDFSYMVTPVAGGPTRHVEATTTEPEVPAPAEPGLSDLAPGRYLITEHSPRVNNGRWVTERVVCDGSEEARHGSASVTVAAGQTSNCTFVNTFIPAGSISVSKITLGNIGTVTFLIVRQGPDNTQYLQRAVILHQGVEVAAVPNSATDATDHLRLGRYLISEQEPATGNPDDWSLVSVECNGQLVPFDGGKVSVVLNSEQPSVNCVYTDQFTETPVPPVPPVPPVVTNPPLPPTPTTTTTTPTPSPKPKPSPTGPENATPANAMANLSLTKQALAPLVVAGQPITYRVAVHNIGPDIAANVVIGDQPLSKANITAARPSSGTCTTREYLICRMGNIRVGGTAVVMVTMIPETRAPEFVNRAVAGGATADSRLSNNVAHAKIKLLHPPSPVACGSRWSPLAIARC